MRLPAKAGRSSWPRSRRRQHSGPACPDGGRPGGHGPDPRPVPPDDGGARRLGPRRGRRLVLVFWPLLADPGRVSVPVRARAGLAVRVALARPARTLGFAGALALVAVITTVLFAAIVSVGAAYVAVSAAPVRVAVRRSPGGARRLTAGLPPRVGLPAHRTGQAASRVGVPGGRAPAVPRRAVRQWCAVPGRG